ncbi:MAG: phosphoadenosine phosphosulfate reductase family protein [Abditibacteriota bacterium]|nr:phosphoadenosine phosphosulfate reductase family protein [Abditibacteriota bacterium]
MARYIYDSETGGILLQYFDGITSNEPRPVYATELNILGVDEYWDYENQDDIPYMWAEANHYYYKGIKIFDTKGGNLYEKPKIEIIYQKTEKEKLTENPVLPFHTKLDKIKIKEMCEKNKEELNILEQLTCKKIYNEYCKYKDKLDCFHVAFSGGKDSIVLLELVKKALPKSSFIVLFGDTQMEFPDTYKIIDIVEEGCKKEGIEFYRAKSHLKPEESWRLFGPPSRALRWCCSVHKSAPQTLKLREILGKKDYIGMDFVGVRAFESSTRATYEEENFGKKQKGQYSFNAILNWTSADVWLYIYSNNLPINEAYKKGNSRAGCLFCPMGGGKGDFFQYYSYSKEMNPLISIVKDLYINDTDSQEKINSYVFSGGWNARKNGRDLTISKNNYKEEKIGQDLIITIKNPRSDWREWIKILSNYNLNYDIVSNDNTLKIIINENSLDKNLVKYSNNSKDLSLKRVFKQVFKKASSCVGCKVCEANCRYGHISFNDGLKINGCIQCYECQDLVNGCLLYNSLIIPTGDKRKLSINSFANHAPKPEWIKDFVQNYKNNVDFWSNNTLGPQQIPRFKKFVKSCGFLDNSNKPTKLLNLLSNKRYNSIDIWGIAYANFAYNTQSRWYIENMEIDTIYTRDKISDMLVEEGLSRDDSTSVINAFKRFCDIPFGVYLKFGNVKLSNKTIKTLSRTKTSLDNNNKLVLLYSLYKYAEECGDYYQFSLSTLMDMTIKSKGISPVKIFGFSRDEMEVMLSGLSSKYTDFIDYTPTHGLEKITLMDYHTSQDVLDLF